MKKAVIIYRFLPHYRVDFYNQLRAYLKERGVELQLIYSKEKDSSRKDEVDLEWATYLPSKVLRIGSRTLLWQPCLDLIRGADLVIAEQANKLLVNYLLISLRKQRNFKFAFWGHGLNLHESPSSVLNRFKKQYVNACDWWFAYTNGVRDYLASGGYPISKITTVQNAIDTRYLTQTYDDVASGELNALKERLQLRSEHVGIYCGSLYKGKRIEFMVQACDIVRQSIPDFELVVVGSGPDLPLLQELATTRPWIHYVGTKFGREKVAHFKLAQVYLMPGVVGLGVLDAFALRTPLVTTTYPFHSPEVEYLENGVNGVITDNTLKAFALGIVSILSNEDYYKKLVQNCRASSEFYTNENMVKNFGEGILNALGMPVEVSTLMEA